MRWVASGYVTAVLWGAASMINSKQHKVQVVEPYNSTDSATALKNSCFVLSERLDFHMLNNLSIAVHAFPMHM